MEDNWPARREPSEWTYAWHCLHDSVLKALESDRLAQTVDLTIELGFPRPSFPAPRQVQIRIEKVNYVSVFSYKVWPGYFDLMASGVSQTSPASDSITAKDRTETISIQEFIEQVQGARPVDIYEPYFAIEGGMACLKLLGIVSDWGTWEMRVDGESLLMETEVGAPITMHEILGIGNRAWEEWSNRKRDE